MPQSTKFSAPVSVRVPKKTLKELDKVARRYGIPRSRLIVDVLENFLEDPPKMKPRRPVATEADHGGEAGVFE